MPPQRFTGVQNNPYYSPALTQINSAYSHMGYPELGSSGASPPTTSAVASYTTLADDSHHQQYLYATSAAATASQMVHNTPASSPSTASAPHSQMVSYTTQPPPEAPAHHQHHQPHAPGGGGQWMPVHGEKTWNEWTTAMVDPSTQDRYSANALLTLGGGQRGPGDSGSGEMGVGGPAVQQEHSSQQQWPLLIYHPPNASGA